MAIVRLLVLDPKPSDHFKYRMNKAIYLELISLKKSNFAFDKIVETYTFSVL